MASVTLASRCINPHLSDAPSAFQTNSNNPRGDDFSTYFSQIKENFTPEFGNSALNRSSIRIGLSRKKNDDGEIDIFGAEKYFSGGMDGSSELVSESGGKQLYMTEREAGAKPRSGTGSTCSESSGNSRSNLLRDRRRLAASTRQNHAKGKGFLGVFRCYCSGKNAIDVDRDSAEDSSSSNSKTTDRAVDKGVEIRQNGESCRRVDRKSLGLKREEEFALANSNPVVGRMTAGGDFGSPFLVRDDLGSSRRSLAILKSAVASAGGSSAMDDDLASESSSDLFEIASLSINSHPFFRPEGTESSTTCYEPSEASIEWSVVTASAASFSVASEYTKDDPPSTRGNGANKTSRQHRPGILLSCVSEKAVEAIAGSDRRSHGRAGVLHALGRAAPELTASFM